MLANTTAKQIKAMQDNKRREESAAQDDAMAFSEPEPTRSIPSVVQTCWMLALCSSPTTKETHKINNPTNNHAEMAKTNTRDRQAMTAWGWTRCNCAPRLPCFDKTCDVSMVMQITARIVNKNTKHNGSRAPTAMIQDSGPPLQRHGCE